MRLHSLLAVVALVACGGRAAPVDDCNDDLSGVWSDGERSWHALDLRGSVELYPMFDSAETDAQSAHALIFVRGPDGVTGHELWWHTDPAHTRRIRHPATLTCTNTRLDITSPHTPRSLVRGRK